MTSLFADRTTPTIAQLRAALVARDLSPVELVTEALARIEHDEPTIAAWVQVDAEAALARARTIDVDVHPLGGIPFGVKDIIDVRGLPTRCGTTWLAARPAAIDAWCVTAVRAAGAIPLGKLHTTAFAFVDPAPTRNPWNPARSPGGSSAGSGAAVGARQIPFAFGTQTGGSVLRPAAYCGAVGFKPTFGTIATAGVAPLAPSIDHVGIICQSAEDATLLFSVFDPSAAAAEVPRAPRVFAPVDVVANAAHGDVLTLVEEAIEDLAEAGAVVTRGALPFAIDEIASCWDTITAYEAYAGLAALVAGEPIGPMLADLIARGSATTPEHYDAAQRRRRALRDVMDAAFAAYDVIALPTAGPVPAPHTTGSAEYLQPWSLFGYPAVTLRAGLTPEGMPAGVQLVGKRGADAALLAVARWAEAGG